MKGRTFSNQKAGVKKLAVGGMGLQKRQFGTGPGQKPMPKHLGKPISGRGFAGGGQTPYVPLSQRTDPESRARALAMSRAMTDKTRAPGSPQQAAVNAARGRLDAARAARNAPPTPPMAAPAGRMSNMAMVKKGGMLKGKKR